MCVEVGFYEIRSHIITMYACVSLYLSELLLVTGQSCCYVSQLNKSILSWSFYLSFSAGFLSCRNRIGGLSGRQQKKEMNEETAETSSLSDTFTAF